MYVLRSENISILDMFRNEAANTGEKRFKNIHMKIKQA